MDSTNNSDQNMNGAEEKPVVPAGPVVQVEQSVTSTAPIMPTPMVEPAVESSSISTPSISEDLTVDKRAKRGFIFGLISIIAWFIPLIGFPITILAIVFSSLGLKSQKNRGKAVTGLVLGIVFIVITLLNSIAGAVIGYSRAMENKNSQNNIDPTAILDQK